MTKTINMAEAVRSKPKKHRATKPQKLRAPDEPITVKQKVHTVEEKSEQLTEPHPQQNEDTDTLLRREDEPQSSTHDSPVTDGTKTYAQTSSDLPEKMENTKENRESEALSPSATVASPLMTDNQSSESIESSKQDRKSTQNGIITERPDTLPTALTSVAEPTKPSTNWHTSQTSAQPTVTAMPHYPSLASHLLQQNIASAPELVHHSSDSGMMKSSTSPRIAGGPAVFEDPNTPMARAQSPPEAQKTIADRTSTPTVPAIIQEEKSPTLLAQEALAKMQALQINPQEMPLGTDSQTLSHPGSEVSISSQHSNQLERVASTDKSLVGIEGEKETVPAVTEKSNVNTMSKSDHSIATEQSVTKSKPVVKPKSLFPHLELEQEKERSRAKLGAMTLQELLGLYYNTQLACNERFVEEFIQKECKKENHEFAEILTNYFRARHQLVSIEEDVRTLQRNYSALQKELWITHIKTLTTVAQCGDMAKVTATHSYEQCELNQEAVSKLVHTMETIRKQISDNLSLFAYSAQMSRLQVESYIYNLYNSCPALRDIPKNAGVQARQQVSPDDQSQIQWLKDCITILFTFHRKPTNDKEFINNIREWTVRLTSTLLRVATFSDHMFILNHLLRCPAGVGRWAIELIQSPSLLANSSSHKPCFGGPVLDHIVTCLATLLLPAKAREDFMCHMRISLSQESRDEEKAWILVDSDGEEDEDPSNAWLYLHENDIVAFLTQFPLAEMFAHILMASVSESGSVDYDIRRSTEPMMLRLFSFTTVFIQLLGAGLKTYSMARYRQLNKRLGRLIRQTVSFVSDHWLNFKMYYGPLASASSMESLQVEFDQLFMRATYSILTAQKLGSWQFMADMPFTCVSSASMWQLLWVLHQGQEQVVNLDHLPPVQECVDYLQDPDSWQQLADNLMHMPTSEAIYLLTTFANMAGCRSSEEETFIQTITLEVFEIAYICNHTREFCSKVGRELLSGIIQTHPTALSFLLVRVKNVLSKLGKMSLYLFSELPISIWQPTDPDMLILRQWLLNFDLMSTENNLARTILGKINWDVFEETGRLVVDIRFHRQMALLLVEAYTRFIADKRAGFFIMEGMKQMATYISGQTPEQLFNNWVWDLVVRLKLHQQSVLLHAFSTVDHDFQPPNLASDAWLLPLLKGTTSRVPIACFVALAMTNVGHDIATFIAEGLDMLNVLTSNYQYTTVIHVLGCVFPIFVDCQQYLLENTSFIQILSSLLAADESLFKSTRSAIMTVEFPGLITRQLTEMIQALVASHLALGKADQVITFWIKAIFKVCVFFTDRNSCYVADMLIQWCFVKKGVLYLVADVFKENYLKFCSDFKNRKGVVTSVFNWISAANTLPSYMDAASLPEFPWLAYMILYVEGEMEVNSSLWQSLIYELHAPGRQTVDQALKSAITKLKLEQYPTSSRLNIYRWAQQALDTPHDHPLLPILWQRFFALYLGRQVFESSIAQRASVGERFFESLNYSSMLKKMRKRLVETSNYHMNFDPSEQKPRKSRPGSSSSARSPPGEFPQGAEPSSPPETPPEDEAGEYTSTREFHQMLARLYQTFSLWLEEPRLHDGNLYLPALPPQYEAARLNQVFQGFMGPWLEFVDLEGVQYNLSCIAADWRKRLTCISSSKPMSPRRNTVNEPEDATERIRRRLRRYDPPKPPPALQNIQSSVPLISTAIVEDQDALMHLVKSDLQVLLHFTQIFSTRCAQHEYLDNAYVELIPSLYANVRKVVQLTAECKSKMNPLHKCTNPAVIPVNVEMKQLNELIQRKIDENRVEYKQVLIESLLPTAPNICVAAVHTENAITLLIKQSQRSSDASKLRRLRNIACHLFYHLADQVCEEVNFYPPTKQFFASCIEILGQEFVSRDPEQTDRVLQLCLNKPKVSGLVSPHFVPNSCPTRLVTMYGQLLHVLQEHNMDLVFMLLTKFDIFQWLTTHNPSEAERKRFVESLGSAIMSCGAEPDLDSKLAFGLYKSHLGSVLESNFPSNLYLVLNMVLQGSASERIHVHIWEKFLTVCFAPKNQEGEKNCFSVEEIEACCDISMSTAQVRELLDWLTSFFVHTKMSGGQETTFGLYANWSRYVPYVALLLGALTRSLVTKVINGTDEMQPYQVMEILWNPLVAVFSPWIQPMVQSDGATTAPWLDSDDTLAYVMVSAMRKSVYFLYSQMAGKYPGAASGVLSLHLMYYITALCTKYMPAYVINVYVGEMRQLPWDKLWPDVQLMEAMTKVKELSSPCCFTLIGHILPRVQWRDVIGHCSSQLHPELANRMQACLAVLLIQAHVDKVFAEDPEVCILLLKAQQFDWSRVTVEGFMGVCSWFLQLCDPKCVLAHRTSNLAMGLQLLKEISGFNTTAVWTDTVSVKRRQYIHCITQQLCQVTYMKEVDPETVTTAIINLLSEIEAVQSTIVYADAQEDESLHLLKDVLSLLNNSNPDGDWLVNILTTVTGWLESSPQSLLLVPYMKASMTCLASLRQMAAVLEAGIEVYFTGLDDSCPGEKGWDFILALFKVPELNQAGYVQDSLSENAFLVLYAYLQFRIAFCDGSMKMQALMEEILDWTSKAQPSQSDEAKLILWWWSLLRLVKQRIEEEPTASLTGVINILSRLANHLGELSHERENKGLLGVMGFGKKSPLSSKMRIFLRALSAFLTTQIVSSDQLRTDPAVKLSQNSTVSELKSLRRHKSYAKFYDAIDQSVSFTQNPVHTIKDGLKFLSQLVRSLFHDQKYLRIIEGPL